MKNFYYLRIINFFLIISFCNQVSIAATTSWKGTTSTAWNNASNWSNGVPTASLDVIIGDAVVFTGTNSPTINVTAFAKSITIGGTKASTLTITTFSITVSGNINITNNGTLIHGNASILLSGNWNNAGTYTANTGSIVTFNGSTAELLGGTATSTFRTLNISCSDVGSVTLTSNIALNGSLLNVGLINVTSGTFDLSTFLADRGTTTVGGTLKVFDNAFLKIGGTRSFPANYGTNTLQSTSTVEYNGASQIISGIGIIYGNLALRSSGGPVSKTAASNISINGHLDIGTSTTFEGGTFSHSVAGDWVNNGTFSPGTSSVTFKGASEMSGNIIQNFYDFIVTGTVDLLGAGTVKIHDLNISEGSLILDFARLQIAGSITNSGTLDASGGTIEMNGAISQSIPANAFLSNNVDNLVINDSSAEGVIIGGPVDVYGSLTYLGTGRKLTTNDFLTLKSSEFQTARVGDMTGNSIVGKVTIERYISPNRSWRLLTSPVNALGSQTIHDAWQEGVNNSTLNANENPNPGFGTQITWGNNPSLGFDVGINDNVGIKGYNTTTGTWDPVPNTNTAKTTDYPAYMVFVRGSRSTDLSLGVNSPSSPTVLRSSGELKVGDQPTIVAATGFTVVSNPFATGMDLNNVAKHGSFNIQDNFYVWDPLFEGSHGVGGFVNFSWDTVNSVYAITPDDTGDGISQFIPSGSGFIAKSSNGSPGILTIKETDKTSAGEVVNRPTNVLSVDNLITNLYSINTDGTTSIVDGVRNTFGPAYSNSVDQNDAVKFSNFNENLSTLRNGQELTVERRQPITPTDTIFLNMLNMKVKSYKFKFKANILSAGNLTGFLEDSYLNTISPIALNDTTEVSFNILNIPGSWNPTRFRIVFRPDEALPITFNSVKAFQQNDDIMVEWKIENETGIKQYEVERSGNGQQFTAATAPVLKRSYTSAAAYNWLDTQPLAGNNFYRIKTINTAGEIHYSSIVKVFTGTGKQKIAIQGNMIANDIITFDMINMPAGNYMVSVINSIGQTIQASQIEHAEGSSTENIHINNHLAKGIYMLECASPGIKKITNKVFVR